MEKNEPVKKELKPGRSEGAVKPSVFSGKVFGIIKFILGVCTLPFVYSVTVAFLSQFSLIEPLYQRCFWWGVIAFLAIYLFVWEPAKVYLAGHKILEVIFSFIKPLLNVAPNLLPIYTILIFITYGILYSISPKSDFRPFLFLIGFNIALHLVFGAKSIRQKKDFLRANYIFGFSLIYIINLCLLVFCFNLVFKEVSFVDFSNSLYTRASDIFSLAFKQLFIAR